MMKSKLSIITILSIVAILISCDSSINSKENENKTTIDNGKEQVKKNNIDSTISDDSSIKSKPQVDSNSYRFVKNLKTGEKLSSFFNDTWLFIYHEDNRCDGSTDGQLDNLKSSLIDSIITLQVKNDGNGWACDKKEPKTFDLDFVLKKKIKDWDRFEIEDYENQEENIVYVAGAGASDFLKLHYNDNDLIIKLEYRSEDPG